MRHHVRNVHNSSASFIAACKIHDVSNVISLHIACRINLIKRHICKRLRHVKCQIMKEIRTLLLLVTKLIHIWRPLRYFIKNTKEIGRLIDLKYENRCCFLFNYFFHDVQLFYLLTNQQLTKCQLDLERYFILQYLRCG